MREIAYLEMPGFGINRLWWTGGRYAYVAAHFDGFTDHVLGIVDVQNITNYYDAGCVAAYEQLPVARKAAERCECAPRPAP